MIFPSRGAAERRGVREEVRNGVVVGDCLLVEHADEVGSSEGIRVVLHPL